MNFLTLLKMPVVRGLLINVTVKVLKELAKLTETKIDDKIVKEVETASKVFLG